MNRDFTVTFDPNGGTIDGEGGIAVKQAKYGEKIEFPVPVRPGYSFGGWFNGDMLCEDGVFQYVQDLNLIARWREFHHRHICGKRRKQRLLQREHSLRRSVAHTYTGGLYLRRLVL